MSGRYLHIDHISADGFSGFYIGGMTLRQRRSYKWNGECTSNLEDSISESSIKAIEEVKKTWVNRGSCCIKSEDIVNSMAKEERSLLDYPPEQPVIKNITGREVKLNITGRELKAGISYDGLARVEMEGHRGYLRDGEPFDVREIVRDKNLRDCEKFISRTIELRKARMSHLGINYL